MEQPAATDDSMPAALVEQVDRALRSCWRGSFEEIERLLGDDGGGPDFFAHLAGIAEASVADAERLPDRFNEYRIVRQIGRGGMAAVYEAVQEHTGQAVALKVIHRGTETLARLFRREVQTLARLKHPGIAALYDAGRTLDGQLYLAMELVSGVPLDQHVSTPAGRVDVPAQLRRFVHICRAVNYAHQRGVIHCDLKPSNIIIAADQAPKVLDFGLARLLDPVVPGSRSLDAGRIMGTLAYMSPEQIKGRRDEIDIRSDVYSLGVVLYEWLTGALPYAVRAGDWPHAARLICEAAPRRPRHAAPHLHADLDVILRKTLQKDPEQRYQSAAALADDVDRFLNGQAILARVSSVSYVVRKFIGRHKRGAAAAALVVLLLTGAIVAVAVQAARTRNALRQAARTRDFLEHMLATADRGEHGVDVRVRDVLVRAAAGLDAELADEPEIRASLHETIGRSFSALARPADAVRHITAALDLRRGLWGPRHPAVASALHQLGRAHWRTGNSDEAAAHLNAAYDMRRSLLGDDHLDVTESQLELSLTVAIWRGQYREAEALARQARDTRRRKLGDHLDVAEATGALARILVAGGRFGDAEPLLVEVLDTQRRRLGPNHADLCRTLTELGEIYWQRADFALAEQAYADRVRILRRMFSGGHHDLAYALNDYAAVLDANCEFAAADQRHREAIAMERAHAERAVDVALNLNDYADFLRNHGRSAEAEPLCREAYALWTTANPGTNPTRAYASQNLAATLLDLGCLSEAEPLLTDAVHCWRTLFGTQNPALSNALVSQGRLHLSRGELAEAERQFDEALTIRAARLGENHYRTAQVRVWLAVLHQAQHAGDPAAESDAAIATMLESVKECHWAVVWARAQRAALSAAIP